MSQSLYPTFRRRVIAATVDVFLLFLVLSPVESVLRYILFNVTASHPVIKSLYYYINDGASGGSIPNLMQDLSDNGLMANFFMRLGLLHIITFSLLFLILSFFWCYKGATPGKMLTKCIIIDSVTGENISFKKAFFRYISLAISLFPLGLGFVTMAFTREKKALHDIISGTQVVMKQKLAVNNDQNTLS